MEYKGGGERWDVSLSEEAPRGGMRPLIFRCTTNTSRGWRVVEVPAEDYTPERVDELGAAKLDALFERSQPFDFTHDPKAVEDHIGDSGAGR